MHIIFQKLIKNFINVIFHVPYVIKGVNSDVTQITLATNFDARESLTVYIGAALIIDNTITEGGSGEAAYIYGLKNIISAMDPEDLGTNEATLIKI